MTHYRWLKGMSGFGRLGARLHPGDTLYCCLPLYHNNAVTVALSAVLGGGATFALGAKFSASGFWDEVRAADATAFVYIGELCRYLLNRPASPRDRDHRVNTMIGNGLRAEIWDEFKSRFGVQRVVEFYGASEGNIAFINVLNADRTAGICPLPHAVVEYDEDSGAPRRGADGRLRRVPRGEVGLLLAKVTDRAPFDGYTDDEASERKLVRDAFDDGDVWFDTGDLVRRQGWWHVAFVDRLGDTFRWKGENVATTEVEGAFAGIPDVEHAVVYGVEVPGTDGKAGMAAITLRDGARFDGAAVARALYEALPAYAVPLFVRVVDELEQTSTFKSKKVDLRKQGYADAEGAPVRARRPHRGLRRVLRRLRRRGRGREAAAVNAVSPTLCGRPVATDRALVMAIVNRTPDSFYDRGATFSDQAAMAAVDRAVDEGADIVDIGGVKAGPGEDVDAAEETRRVVPFVAWIRVRYPRLPISVDTWRSDVARAAVARGGRSDQRHLGRRRPGSGRGGGRHRRRNRVQSHWRGGPAHPSAPGALRRCGGPGDRRTRRGRRESVRHGGGCETRS